MSDPKRVELFMNMVQKGDYLTAIKLIETGFIDVLSMYKSTELFSQVCCQKAYNVELIKCFLDHGYAPQKALFYLLSNPVTDRLMSLSYCLELVFERGAKLGTIMTYTTNFTMEKEGCQRLNEVLQKQWFKQNPQPEPVPVPEQAKTEPKSELFSEEMKKSYTDQATLFMSMFGLKQDPKETENFIETIFKTLAPFEKDLKCFADIFTQKVEEQPVDLEKEVEDESARIMVIHKGDKIEDVISEAINLHRSLHSTK